MLMTGELAHNVTVNWTISLAADKTSVIFLFFLFLT